MRSVVLARGKQRYDRDVTRQPFDRNPAGRGLTRPVVAWVTAVALLVVALAGAVTFAVHYRSEVTTLQRHVPQSAGTHSPRTSLVRLASTAVRLPPRGKLTGGVIIVTAKSASGPIQIELAVHINGARPRTSYVLIAYNCAGGEYQTWAAGLTNARGSGTLNGHAMPVSAHSQYWFYVSPSSSGAGAEAGLRGSLTAAGNLSASPAGNPACS